MDWGVVLLSTLRFGLLLVHWLLFLSILILLGRLAHEWHEARSPFYKHWQKRKKGLGKLDAFLSLIVLEQATYNTGVRTQRPIQHVHVFLDICVDLASTTSNLQPSRLVVCAVAARDKLAEFTEFSFLGLLTRKPSLVFKKQCYVSQTISRFHIPDRSFLEPRDQSSSLRHR